MRKQGDQGKSWARGKAGEECRVREAAGKSKGDQGKRKSKGRGFVMHINCPVDVK